MGTFLIFFLLILMGLIWWLGLAYDRIFRSARECSMLRGELVSAAGKPGSRETTEKLACDLEAASREANRQICDTVSGRIIARAFRFRSFETRGQ